MNDPTGKSPASAPERRPHQIAGLVLLLFGLFIVWQALKLRYYTSLGPGPGFFSFWLGVLLSLLSAAWIAGATFGVQTKKLSLMPAEPVAYLRIAAIVAGLVLVVLLLQPLGFPLTVAGFLALVLLSGGAGWRATVIGAFTGGFGAYFIFVHLLHVPLPQGIFWF